ncbi:autotransporter-associated beta strand repeat-containing protein, partial [Flavobacteriaceae bacterium]|nr:autotransporter-associated beta strand repeat-containing protein [Flavobacteriaceae bacterium]
MLAKRFLCFYLFLFSALCAQLGYGQTLTISDSGQTGTSGTHWSISGNTLAATGDANVHPGVITDLLASGETTISFSNAESIIKIENSIYSFSTHNLSINSDSKVEINASPYIIGGLEITSQEIFLNADVNSGGTQEYNGDVILKRDIILNSNLSIDSTVYTSTNEINLTIPTAVRATLVGGAGGKGGDDGQVGEGTGPSGKIQSTLYLNNSEIFFAVGVGGSNGEGCNTNSGGGAAGTNSLNGAYNGGAGGNAGNSGCSGGGGGGGAASLLRVGPSGTNYLIAGGAGGGAGGNNVKDTLETAGQTANQSNKNGTNTFGQGGSWGGDPFSDGGGGGGGGGGYWGGSGGNTDGSADSETTGYGGYGGGSGETVSEEIVYGLALWSETLSNASNGSITIEQFSFSGSKSTVIFNETIKNEVSTFNSLGLVGNATFKKALGTSSSKITSLTITGTTQLSSDINTSVQQSFSEKLTISNASAILDSPSFSFSAIEINTYSLTIKSEGANEISSIISGSGNLIKSGTGTLTLSAKSTFVGDVTINEGVLDITSTGGLYNTGTWGSHGVVTVNSNATLRLYGLASSTGSLGYLSYYASNLVINGGTLEFTGVNGVMGDAASNGTTNKRAFTVGVNGATLLNNTSTTWSFWRDDDTTDYNPVFNGDLTFKGTGNFDYYNRFESGTFNNNIIKHGSGTLKIRNGNNDFTGAVTVNDGLLDISVAADLGNTSGVTINNGGTLQLSGGINVSSPLTLNGNGVSSLGALYFLSGNNTYSGAITLGSNTSITSAAGNQTISGSVNGAYDLSVTSEGTWTQSGEVGGTTPLTNYSLNAGVNNITLSGGHQVAGPISIYGGDITVSGNITSILSGADVLLKAAGDISLESGNEIATKGGDLILWANSDNDGNAGAVLLRRNSTINTGSSSVEGGNLWIGGGSGTETWNDMTVGNGYATAATTIDPDNGSSDGGGNITAAVYLENTNINTFGGAVKIKADGLDKSTSFISYGNNTIDAGSGTINIEGEISSSSSGTGIIIGIHAVRIDSELTLKSSASDTAVILNSKGVGAREGIHISGKLTIESSGTGDVEINANQTGTGYGIEIGAYYDGILNVYAASGDIDIDSGARGLYVLNGNLGSTPIISKLSLGQGGSISSSSSDVNIIGDVVSVNSNTGGITVNTNGKFSLLPSSDSFSSDISWPISDFSVSNISGLTIGKETNTSNTTISSDQTVNGPISVYGGDITLSNSVTASGTLLLQGSGATTQSAAISATTLSLQGSGTFTLNNSENHVEYLTAGTATQTTGNISLTNKDALIIGDGSNGIRSTGTIQVGTLSGNLTLANNISTDNTTNSAIKLYADQGEAAGSEGQGNIIISGTPTITTTGLTSLYSGKPSSSDGLLDLVEASNIRIGVDTTTEFNPALSSEVYALFRTGPEITFTESFNSFFRSDNAASAPQTMVVSATGLTADVLLTPPTGFELSTDGNSFSDSLTLADVSVSLENTTVYVRVKSSASGYPSGTMSLTTTGATPKGITLQAAASAALHFDGEGDYVAVNDLKNYINSDFTIEFWMNMDDYDENPYIFSVNGPTGSNRLLLGINKTSTPSKYYPVLYLYYPSENINTNSHNDSEILLNEWNHLVLTRSGDKYSIYLNSSLVGELNANSSRSFDTDSRISLGQEFDDGLDISNEFYGKLDELSFWSKALTQEEIESQMFETLQGNESGLLAYYNFNDGVPGQSNSGNTTLSDLEGNADGTLNNFGLGSGTTSTWVAHPFPEASLESGYTKMPVALWKEIGTNETRSSNGLTMSVGTTLTEANYANFASNSNTGTTTTEVPLTDKTRSQRIWYVNETGVVTATVKIGVASATGQAASVYKNPSFSLLYRAGTSGTFSQTQTGTLIGDVVTFVNEPLQDGFYALGIVENITLTPSSSPSKTHGETDPTFTFTTNPSVTLSGVLTRTAGENVGTYSLSIGTISSTQYSITLVDTDFTITTKTVTVTLDDKAKKNKLGDPPLTYTSDPVVNTSLPNSSTITFTGTITRTAGEVVGTYSITQGTLTNTNYTIVFIPGTFTISPTVPDINGFTDLTLTYGDANLSRTYTSTSTGTPTYTISNTNVATINSSTGSITTVGVGTTTVWLSLEDDGTYEPGTASMTLTVAALPMTVTADPQTKVYGATDPELTYSYVPSGPLTNTHTVTFTGTLTRTTNENAGTYSITIGTLTNTNYSITYVGADFTITSKTLTITAVDKTKVYDSAVYTPTDYSVGYIGFVDGEDENTLLALSGTLTYTGTALTATNSGTYVITPGGLTSNNYSITYLSGELSITQKPITIAITDQTKIFGDSDPSPFNAHSISVGSVYGQTPTGVLTRTAGEDVDTYTIGRGDLTYGSNYIESFENGNLTITARTITVTAAAETKVYGESDPPLTYIATPVVGDPVVAGSSATVTFTGAITRDAGDNAGTYSITLGTLTNTNYTIDYVGADFTITKALTAISDTGSAAYTDTPVTFGDSDIFLTSTSSNTADYTFTSSNSSVASITTTSTNTASIRNLKVGSAIITIAQGTDTNYQAKTVSYTIIVNPLPVTVTPTATQSKTYGEADLTLTYDTSPTLNSTLTNTTGTVTFTGDLSRDAGTNVGSYSIAIGTLTNTNYALTLTEVDYTINKRPVTISADYKTKVYGATDPSLTYTIKAGSIVSGDSETGVLTRTAGETAGTYTITQNTLTYG